MRTVLVLCTGNSCRSQMAEALINHDLAGRWQAESAGTRPTGTVHPLALRALAEIGIHHKGESKSVEVYAGKTFDAVITVCDQAAEECPVWLGPGRKTHIGFPDPALTQGSEEERMRSFRSVRDDIRRQLVAYLNQID